MKIRKKARLVAAVVAKVRSWARGPFHASWKTAKQPVVGIRVIVWKPQVRSRIVGAPASELVADTVEVALLFWTAAFGAQW